MSCKPDRMQFMVVNTTEPNAIENAEDWANDHFSFTNSHRQQLHDKGTHV